MSKFVVNTVTADGLVVLNQYLDGILPKGPYPSCWRMADRPFWQDTLDLHCLPHWSTPEILGCPVDDTIPLTIIQILISFHNGYDHNADGSNAKIIIQQWT